MVTLNLKWMRLAVKSYVDANVEYSKKYLTPLITRDLIYSGKSTLVTVYTCVS